MIKVQVASAQKKIFDGEVAQLTIKSVDGVFSILPNHVPVITLIKNGYIEASEFGRIEIQKAFVSVNANSTIDILVSEL